MRDKARLEALRLGVRQTGQRPVNDTQLEARPARQLREDGEAVAGQGGLLDRDADGIGGDQQRRISAGVRSTIGSRTSSLTTAFVVREPIHRS